MHTRRPHSPFPYLALLFFAAIATTACEGEQATERGGIGKADLFGSCQADDCGEMSADGNCWCDEECANVGDCCANKAEICDGDTGVQACGGLAGLVCDAGEYCHYEESMTCGAADHLGECRVMPEFCAEIFQPVCGCDGNDYGNSCFANAAGTSVAHEGECNGGPAACCSVFDFPEFAFEPVQCCEDGSWQMTGSASPCSNLGMAEGAVCEAECGGFAGLSCSDSSKTCVDNPADSCDPDNGGADCGGVCVTCPEFDCPLGCPSGGTKVTNDGPNGCPVCVCTSECEAAGGFCAASPSDPGFPAICEVDFPGTVPDATASCDAFNEACCVPPA